MRPADIGKLLSLLQGAYPHWRLSETTAAAWHLALEKEPYESMMAAATEYMRSETRTPTPAGLLAARECLRISNNEKAIAASTEPPATQLLAQGFSVSAPGRSEHEERWWKAMAQRNYAAASRALEDEHRALGDHRAADLERERRERHHGS